MPRPLKFPEEMVARFEPGTFARIDASLAPDKSRGEFVREAVMDKLKRRERELKRQELAGRLTRLRAPR
jgi:hypothetical protein